MVRRVRRIVIPNIPHHVTHHGVRLADLFFSDEERNKYLYLLKEQCLTQGMEIVSWCLMANHVHLVCVPKREDALAKVVGEAHRRYSRYVNRKKGFKGHLFCARFYSCPMDEKHALAAIRYIERNPVRAGIVEHVKDYPWSSARFRLKVTDDDPFLRAASPLGFDVDWGSLLGCDPDEMEFIRKSSKMGRICGSKDFVERLEEIAGRRLKPMKRGRPLKKCDK